VGGNQSIEVAENQKEEIGGAYNLTVGRTGSGAIGALAGVAVLPVRPQDWRNRHLQWQVGAGHQRVPSLVKSDLSFGCAG